MSDKPQTELKKTPIRGFKENPVINLFIFLFVIFIAIGFFISHFEAQNKQLLQKEKVNISLGKIKAVLENRLYSNIHRAEGVRAIVAMNPDLTQEEYANAIKINFQEDNDLRNIGLAKGMTIRYMYPIEGNEAAIGLDFTKIPNQFVTADLARRVNRIVIAGPLELVQGGNAIIARIPIYINEQGGSDSTFWGLASVVLNTASLYEQSGLNNLSSSGIKIAIRGKDSMGESGDVFFGDPSVFNNQPITTKIELPYGSWLIGAIPVSGWESGFFSFSIYILIYVLSASIVLLLTLITAKIYNRLKYAETSARLSNTAKSEFLANMSHEIRTPLNGIIGFSELLIKSPLNDIQKQYCENIQTSGNSLLAIINDILDLSKIESGKLDLEFIETDLFELLYQSTEIIKYHAEIKGLELILNIQPDLPRIDLFDPLRLKQIIINLLSNAVKFTEKGEVELKVIFCKLENNRGQYEFSIRDTGIGITDEQKHKLFKSFSQADSSTTRKFGGTGLGLIISDLLARKMGSTIQVESKWGEGSRFYFTIETSYSHKIDSSKDKLFMPFKNALLIENNISLGNIFKNQFNYWGLNLSICENTQSAIDNLKTNIYDVIIVDYNLPDTNGLQTVRKIKDMFNNEQDNLNIILLYNIIDDQNLLLEIENSGVKHTLTKPVKTDELYKILIQKEKKVSKNDTQHKNNDINIKSDFSENSKSPVILVAEDIVLNMILINALIKEIYPNAIIIEAINGQEAYNKTIANKIDLIIMDIQMPLMDGIETTVKIRNWEKDIQLNSRLPIIALSAGTLKEELDKALAAGIDDFLTKPVEPIKLRENLLKYIDT